MDSDKTTVERQPATTYPRSTVTFPGTNIEWRREGKTWTLYSGDELIRGASGEERQLIDACLAATPSLEAQAPQPLQRVVSTAPERIYLVIGEDFPEDEEFPATLDEVSWCADKIDANSIEYVRADLASPASDGLPGGTK